MVNFDLGEGKLMTNIACPRLSVPTIGRFSRLLLWRCKSIYVESTSVVHRAASQGVTPPAPVPNLRIMHLGAACSQTPPAPKTLTAQGFRLFRVVLLSQTVKRHPFLGLLLLHRARIVPYASQPFR